MNGNFMDTAFGAAKTAFLDTLEQKFREEMTRLTDMRDTERAEIQAKYDKACKDVRAAYVEQRSRVEEEWISSSRRTSKFGLTEANPQHIPPAANKRQDLSRPPTIDPIDLDSESDEEVVPQSVESRRCEQQPQRQRSRSVSSTVRSLPPAPGRTASTSDTIPPEHEGHRPEMGGIRAHIPPHNGDSDPMTGFQKAALLKEMGRLSSMSDTVELFLPLDLMDVGLPDYQDIVENPMDLSTMQEKLELGDYASLSDFVKDMELVISNFKLYFGETHRFTKKAKRIGKRLWEKVEELRLASMGLQGFAKRARLSPGADSC